MLPTLLAAAAVLGASALSDLGAHAGFPVERALPGAQTFTYMSVEDPNALNLDGSRYGIAVCLSTVSKANWTFSTDGGGWWCVCGRIIRGGAGSVRGPSA
jgi:hypothetical protein